MAKVLLAGESWITSTTEYKGYDSFTSTKLEIGCVDFLKALRHAGHEVTHMKAHDVPERFPWTMEELDRYDVVVLSDIGSNSLLLPNRVFALSRPTTNRLQLLADWVKCGHALMMAGGYLSFSGFEAKAHYHGTPIEMALPVSIAPYDDRVECPQGIRPEVVTKHPITEGLSTLEGGIPPLLGYQRLDADSDATVLMKAGDDPLLIIGDYGRGRTAAFASDISPHWTPEEFMHWPGYEVLFGRLIDWLVSC